MDEYISKIKFEELMRKKARSNFDLYYADKSKHYHEKAIGYNTAADEAHDFPSADVQPVKHGKWEEIEEYGGWGDTHYRCSVCGEEWYLEDGTPQQNNMNFCPRCGARMDLDSVIHDRCSNYMDCDGNCFIDDTPCDCNGNIEKCKGR